MHENGEKELSFSSQFSQSYQKRKMPHEDGHHAGTALPPLLVGFLGNSS
jgi:hypothetical protein